MPTRLVTMLGLGNRYKPETLGYDPVVYEIEGRRAARTPLVMKAITECLAPVEAVVVLGTQEVQAQRVDTGDLARALGRPFQFVCIPKGEDEAERWELFRHIQAALAREPLEAAGEAAAPTEILFDVTHGFRTQPLFAMAVLSFTQAAWVRDRVAEAPTLRVLYGAYDPNNKPTEGGAAPIWDLTQQLSVTRWSGALDALQRFGRADDLEALGQAVTRWQVAEARARGESGAQLGRYNAPKRFGELARGFADALALARFAHSTADAVDVPSGALERGSALALDTFLASEEAQALQQALPVLEDSFQRLRAWLQPLRTPTFEGWQSLQALAALAQRFGHLERYSEQIAAVREGLVLLFAAQTGRPLALRPGQAGYDRAYDTIERSLGAVAAKARQRQGEGCEATAAFAEALRAAGIAPTPTRVEIARCFADCAQPRNDIHHGGLNQQPRSAQSLRTQLTTLCERFCALVEHGPDADAPATDAGPGADAPPGCFLNLSNHPLAQWSSAQREAAEALGHGAPRDLPGAMPQVDPAWDTAAVEALADDVAERAVREGARGAFVATDFTLTVALVRALQRRGVAAYSATTRRESSEEVGADGAVVKRSVFTFVAWRAYPRAG